MGLKIEILSKSGPYLEIEALSLTLNLEEVGQITVLPHHAPLIGVIDICECKIIGLDEKKHYFAISGGVLHVDKDKTLILANSIESIDDIDFERANNAKLRAEKRISSRSDNVDLKRAQASLSRALNRLNILSRNNPQDKK